MKEAHEKVTLLEDRGGYWDSVLGELSTELCGDLTMQSRTWRAGAAEDFTLGTSAGSSSFIHWSCLNAPDLLILNIARSCVF